MSRFLIPRADYQRIFRTVYSVLSGDVLDITKSCVPINVIGAALLNRFYNIDARPFAGLAAYCVKPGSVMLFASQQNGELEAKDGGFHCWVETQDWVLDFTAPLFPLLIEGSNMPNPGPKMMQRRYQEVKKRPDELTESGDYFVYPDLDLTKEVLTKFMRKQGSRDLVNICENWFTVPPKAMLPSIGIGNEKGEVREVTFSRYEVIGEW